MNPFARRFEDAYREDTRRLGLIEPDCEPRVSEHLDDELLRATVAADGVLGGMLGPWSAGSGLQLLLTAANRALAWPAGRSVEGGPAARRGPARI